MKDIAIDCYMSVKSSLNPNKRRNCFELFGFDFMIDEDFRVWLIEINTNPYIGIHNNGMKEILPKMFSDLFSIVLDPVFGSEANTDNKSYFDLLYSRSRGINKRRANPAEGIYPVKKLDNRRFTATQRKLLLKKQRFDEAFIQGKKVFI